jgi:hypothetical protein
VPRPRIALAAAALVAAGLAGCGNNRTPTPDVGFIAAPKGFRAARYPAQGLQFRAPTNWLITRGEGPHVATVAMGEAQVGVWRYPRTEPLPETRDQLRAARDAVVKQIEARDPTFKLTSTRLVRKKGIRAVEIVGLGTNLTNARAHRSVRSLHAYGRGAEVVIDAFAPTKEFPRVDKQTFGPMTRSLKLRAPS